MVTGEDINMRAAAVAAVLFLLFLIPAYAIVDEAVPRTYSAYGTFETTPCEECPNFENYEYPFMFSSVDVEGRMATYSMAVSKEGRREPVEGATLFVQIYDSNWEVIGKCRLYTGEDGTGTLDYSDYMRGARNCTGGCVARASFCCGNPVALKCTIANCLGEELGEYSDYPPSYPPCSGYDGAWPEYAAVGGEEYAILPASTDAQIPAEQETLPLTLGFSLCFPLTVIFGLLAAAMYASGRDPFAMFSFYTPRYTRGFERPVGARGFTLSGSGLLSVVSGIVKASSGGGGGKQGSGKVGEGNKVVAQGAGAGAAVKGQPGGVRMAAGTGERPRAIGPSAVREGPQGRPGLESARPGEAPRLEGRMSSAEAAAERAAAARTESVEIAATARIGGPIATMVRAIWSPEAREALKQMFREFRPDVASGATGENQYYKIGFGEFLLELTSTVLIYSALPLFATSLIAKGFALATQSLAGARNLENMDHDLEMMRGMRENPDGTVTVTYTDVYGEKSTETFERGSSRFSNFLGGMAQRYQSAVEFNNAAMHDSNAGLAQSSHEALSGDEGRSEVVGELVEGRGMDKELEAIWLSPNAENLGAVLDRHLSPEIMDNISIVLTNKKADGTFVTADERTAAIEFVQNNREALGASLSALVLFSNRGGDIAAVRDGAAVSALLGLAGNADAMGALLTGADGKIDIAAFNSLTVLAATLRANEDGKMSELGGRVEMLLTNAVDGARQNAEERARRDTSINPSEIFSAGSETERRVAQLGIGELMYQSEFYVTGEGGSANGRFADMSYYDGSVHGSILGVSGGLSGDSLEQFNAAYGKFEGLAGAASALGEGLAAQPERAEGADAIFGTASAWLSQRGAAVEAEYHLGVLDPLLGYNPGREGMMYLEAAFDKPEFRDIMASGGEDGRDAVNDLWDTAVSKPDELAIKQEIVDALNAPHNPNATIKELGTAADYFMPGMRDALATIADQSSSTDKVREALGRITGADLSHASESDLVALRESTLGSYELRMASNREEAERQATIALNPAVEQLSNAFSAPRNPNATLEELGAAADYFMPGMRDALATIADQSSSNADVTGALGVLTSSDLSQVSQGELASLRESALEHFGIKAVSAQEEAARQATIALNPMVEQQAAQYGLPDAYYYYESRTQGMNEEGRATVGALESEYQRRAGGAAGEPTAAYTDAVNMAKDFFSFNGIDTREQRVLDTLSDPASSAIDVRRAMDYVADRFYVDTSTQGQRAAYTTLMDENAGSEDKERAAQALAASIRVDWTALQQPSQEAGDWAREQLVRSIAEQRGWDEALYHQMSGRPIAELLPPDGTFMDAARRTTEGYFNGPLGRDAMEHQQQTLDQFGILNPNLATYKAETVELNPESQRIENREEGERRAAERGGFGAEWQAAESAIAAKKAEEERRRRGLGGEGQG